jgi:hypothetical protein
VSVVDDERAAKAGLAKGDKPIFADGVVGVRTRYGQGVMED